jgi:hypothetical protein
LRQNSFSDDRIGVLDDEVAGVARHHHGLRRTLASFADFDHKLMPFGF